MSKRDWVYVFKMLIIVLRSIVNTVGRTYISS